MSVEAKFYVPLPDERWYPMTGSREIVIKAYESRSGDQNILVILEPSDFAGAFIGDKLVSSYIECSGPARRLSGYQYAALVHSLRPDIELPQWMTAEKIKEYMSRTELHSP